MRAALKPSNIALVCIVLGSLQNLGGRWLILSLIAYLLAHWITQWSISPVLDWKATSDLPLSVLFPSVLWLKLLRYIRINTDITARYGFEIVLKPIST